jgi:uncharacterized membrane protein YfcA
MGMEYAALGGLAFLAGLVDAIAGGGGLIQLPALLSFLPAELAAVPVLALGTNKLASICGTSVAAVRYLRQVAVPWAVVAPAAGSALLGSALGAAVATTLNPHLLKPLVVALLLAMAWHTFHHREAGESPTASAWGHRPRLAGLLVGAAIGFYDGFFGPGTGSFLIFLFVRFFGCDFLQASASAKLINVATNLSAVAWFAGTHHILYAYALPMAACNILGSLVGSRLALTRGSRFVRRVFLVVVLAILARLAWGTVAAWLPTPRP